MTPPPLAMALQKSAAVIDGQSATLVKSASMISESSGRGMFQVTEVADGEQGLEMRHVICKELVDSEVQYWVKWSTALVSIGIT